MRLYNARQSVGKCKSGRWATDSIENTETLVWAKNRDNAAQIAADHWGIPEEPAAIVVRSGRLGINWRLYAAPNEERLWGADEKYIGWTS